MQRSFDWSGSSFWERAEALDSSPIVEYVKDIWLIRTSLLRNQRHWTHCYVGTCKSYLIRTSLLRN
jgi:hypothetical protein